MIGPGSSRPNVICPIRSGTGADLPKPPETVVSPVLNVNSVGKHRGAVAAKAIPALDATVAREPENARRHADKTHVVHRHFAFYGTGGWSSGAGSECRPSSAKYGGERTGDPFTVLNTAYKVPFSASLVHHRDDPTSTVNPFGFR